MKFVTTKFWGFLKVIRHMADFLKLIVQVKPYWLSSELMKNSNKYCNLTKFSHKISIICTKLKKAPAVILSEK